MNNPLTAIKAYSIILRKRMREGGFVLNININTLPQEIREAFESSKDNSLAEIEIKIVDDNNEIMGVIVNDFVFRSMKESIELYRIPGFIESINESLNEPLEECTKYKEGEEW